MPVQNAPCAVQGQAALARGYNRLKALFMAAEALVQAWLSDLARRAALASPEAMGLFDDDLGAALASVRQVFDAAVDDRTNPP